MMQDIASDLNQTIADIVRELRAARGLSLDALAAKSGVSRSMLSLVERGESSPTAVVLNKIARGLEVTLASLFTPSPSSAGPLDEPVSRRGNRIPWRDPGSGYVRCNISPTNVVQPMQIVEVDFPAGGRVTFEHSARDVRIFQQLWVLDGKIEITLGDKCHCLEEGDCLAMELDRPAVIHNPTRRRTRYTLVVVSEQLPRR